jgi:Flp pilus assembly protein TadG
MITRALTSIRDRAGAAAIEFALLVPVLATLLFGLFEGSQAILAYMKLIAATQTIADLITQQQSIGATDFDNFNAAGKLVMGPFPTAAFGYAATSVTFDPNTGAAAVAWQDTRNATPLPNATTLAAGYGQKGESVIIVQGNYAYSSVLHYVLPGTLNMSQIAFSRPRLVGSIPHT